MKDFDEKLSVRDTERLVKKLLEEKPEIVQKTDSSSQVIYHDLEEKLKSIIGSKVVINRKANNKGKIEIEYYSTDELDRIVELINRIH